MAYRLNHGLVDWIGQQQFKTGPERRIKQHLNIEWMTIKPHPAIDHSCAIRYQHHWVHVKPCDQTKLQTHADALLEIGAVYQFHILRCDRIRTQENNPP